MLAEAVETHPWAADETGASDEVLVARYRAGDRSAFDVLYLRHKDRLRGVMGRFVSDGADAEDLVQEAFLKAFRALPRFRGESKFFTWLYQIAINTGINFIQRRSAEYTNAGALDVETDVGPERLWSLAEQEQRTLHALGQLASPMAQALVLNAIHGLEYAEVSDVLDCPLGTVRSRISRARRLLAEAVAE